MTRSTDTQQCGRHDLGMGAAACSGLYSCAEKRLAETPVTVTLPANLVRALIGATADARSGYRRLQERARQEPGAYSAEDLETARLEFQEEQMAAWRLRDALDAATAAARAGV